MKLFYKHTQHLGKTLEIAHYISTEKCNICLSNFQHHFSQVIYILYIVASELNIALHFSEN